MSRKARHGGKLGRPKLDAAQKKQRVKIAPEITHEAKAILDKMVRPGRSQGDVISIALMAYEEACDG